jgi:hypothetical protein
MSVGRFSKSVMIVAAANLPFQMVNTVTEGRVVDPVRERACDFQENVIGSVALNLVNCEPEKPPEPIENQATQQFGVEGSDEAYRLVRNLTADYKRDRGIDAARSRISGDFVAKMTMPDATVYEGEDGIFRVRSIDGDRLSLSRIKFETLHPGGSRGDSPNNLDCVVGPDDPAYQGCVDADVFSGFLNNLPGLGADNNNHAIEASFALINSLNFDYSCVLTNIMMPGLSEAAGRPLTLEEALMMMVRANIRAEAWEVKGVAPQKIDIMMTADGFHEPQSFQKLYNGLRRQPNLKFLPEQAIPDDYCVADGNQASVNGVLPFDSMAWSFIATMGAEKGSEIPDYYNPSTGKLAPNARNLRRDG